jgi:A/G-specific adenine glycosylase
MQKPQFLQLFFASWFRTSGRRFPWRSKDTTPFGMLIAEILLKQTRAEMVAEVWPSLIARYPNPQRLASADPAGLMAHIGGLGLGKQRTDALIQLGQALVTRFNSVVPRDITRLESLPHVGLYSARAVACFAFGIRVPVVDGNVVRVICRLKGLPPVPDIRRHADEVWKSASRMLPASRGAQHNYGLLDFAAAICRARTPLCNTCPLRKKCSYFSATFRAKTTSASRARVSHETSKQHRNSRDNLELPNGV